MQAGEGLAEFFDAAAAAHPLAQGKGLMMEAQGIVVAAFGPGDLAEGEERGGAGHGAVRGGDEGAGTALFDLLFNASDLIERMAENDTPHTVEIGHTLLARMATRRGDHATALLHVRRSIEAVEREGNPHRSPFDVGLPVHVLHMTHHAGDDDAFDEAAPLVEMHYRHVGWSEALSWALFIHAENHLARGRVAEARAANDEVLAIDRRMNKSGQLPATLHQRAQILRKQGELGEARLCWNEAMAGFDAQGTGNGVADCLQGLAQLHAASGAFVEAIFLLKQAICLYEQVGDVAAVQAGRGTLGDVLAAKGEFAEARGLYEEGLAFWQAKGHPRWTRWFEQRIRRLDSRPGGDRAAGQETQ